MSDSWDIKTFKNKSSIFRERLEKRKKERNGYMHATNDYSAANSLETEDDTTLELEAEIEITILKLFCSSTLVLPIISTQILSKLERLNKSPTRSIVDYTLGKLAANGAVHLQNVTIDQEAGYEVVSVNMSVIQKWLHQMVKENFEMKDELKRKCNDEKVESTQIKKCKINNHGIKEEADKIDHNSTDTSDEIMSLLALPSTREKQSKQTGQEILELLTKPTAKERSVVEKFQSHGGAQVMEFCPHGTKVECFKAQQALFYVEMKKKQEKQADKTDFPTELEDSTASESPPQESNVESVAQTTNTDSATLSDESSEQTKTPIDNCKKLHFKKILQTHTDETLGDCSFLNTCFHMATCKYVHYEVDALPNLDANPKNSTDVFLKRGADAKVKLYPPQWIQCDLRFLDMSILGKFSVVMADPPWDIHMELPYGTMSDDEMRQLGVPTLQDDGLIFLWVTGRAMELGRECLKLWGYERVDELIWVKTNQLQRIIRTGRTGHWLNHGKEHCLVGMKGNPTNLNRGLDCDVIVAEVRATSHKPDEIYGIIERLSPGTRKIELFGRPHNVQPNWITLGNQLDGIRLVDPELVKEFQQRYPDGNCMLPAGNVASLPTQP